MAFAFVYVELPILGLNVRNARHNKTYYSTTQHSTTQLLYMKFVTPSY